MLDTLTAADARIRSHPDLALTRNLLVAHRGELVFARYYRDSGPEVLHSTHSVTKSVVSTLVGILVGDGLLALDTPVASLVPAPAFAADAAKAAISVGDLLTMSSGLDGGLDGDQHWDIDALARRGEPLVEGALQAPLVAVPGAVFSYNNGAAHVLSAVIEAAAGRSAEKVAAERLFAPLGIERWRWPTDPQGRPWGCGGLELTGRDLLKLGVLYLAGGTWHGHRVVDEEYVRAATSPRNGGGPPERCPYGLLWWVAAEADPPMFFAAGHGGQFLFVVPALDLVIVTMADAEAVARPMGRPLRQLVTGTIVPAFA